MSGRPWPASSAGPATRWPSIDRDPAAFRRLGSDFHGQQVTGMGFDRDVLLAARIMEAHAFAAVSSGDNSNIIAARVAREQFNVETVVARIYDAKRAQVYERLGIPTVATVPWTTDRLLRAIIPEGLISEWRDPSGHRDDREPAVPPALDRPAAGRAGGRGRHPHRLRRPVRPRSAAVPRNRCAGR